MSSDSESPTEAEIAEILDRYRRKRLALDLSTRFCCSYPLAVFVGLFWVATTLLAIRVVMKTFS